MKKHLIRSFITVVILWFGISAALFIISDKIIYRTELSRGEDYPFVFERISVKNSSGDDIEMLWIPARSGPKTTDKAVLYLHGNAGRLPNIIEGLSDFGSVLSPAYPGYSRSGGSPDTENINETADIGIAYLRAKGIPDKDIIVLGHSLGGSPAVYAASKYPDVDRVILVNTFLSMGAMCRSRYYIFCVFAGNIHDSAAWAGKARARIRQFHNPHDDVVPYNQGQALFGLIGSRDKKFYDIAGTHADFPIESILNRVGGPGHDD